MKRILLILLLVFSFISIVFLLNRTSNSVQNEINEKENEANIIDSQTSKECSGKTLTPLTEGPYYKSGSPKRQNILEADTSGTHLIIKGYVLDTDCKPISNAWLDFWQADGNGNYDNIGYKLRGHQYTNKDGFYRLETVIPAEYPGRTPHIHFKVKATDTSQVFTSQLFFPEASANETDSIFDESLVITMGEDPDGSKYASYNIVVPGQ